MNCINNYLYVTFDENHRFLRTLDGGMEVIVPEMWEYTDDWGQKNGRMDGNLNGLEANPQIAYVLAGNNNFNPGDKVFLHFLAWENALKLDLDNYSGCFIRESDVFFVDNGEILMCKDTYLGIRVMREIFGMEAKSECYIELTDVCDGRYGKGDVIVTIDDAQYPVQYRDKEYIKVMKNEIVGIK